MSDSDFFTVVFKGNLRDFKGNPLTTETVFGVPIACGYGDAFEETDRLREMLDKAEARS
jgi:hypothetical protein